MIAEILGLVTDEFAVGHVADVLSIIDELLGLLEEDYLKDKNVRNAAIDAICQFLQSKKVA